MQSTTRTALPMWSRALELVDLLYTGVITKIESHPGGSVTVTPLVGAPVLLTRAVDVDAYIARATGADRAVLVHAQDAAAARAGR